MVRAVSGIVSATVATSQRTMFSHPVTMRTVLRVPTRSGTVLLLVLGRAACAGEGDGIRHFVDYDGRRRRDGAALPIRCPAMAEQALVIRTRVEGALELERDGSRMQRESRTVRTRCPKRGSIRPGVSRRLRRASAKRASAETRAQLHSLAQTPSFRDHANLLRLPGNCICVPSLFSLTLPPGIGTTTACYLWAMASAAALGLHPAPGGTSPGLSRAAMTRPFRLVARNVAFPAALTGARRHGPTGRPRPHRLVRLPRRLVCRAGLGFGPIGLSGLGFGPIGLPAGLSPCLGLAGACHGAPARPGPRG